MHSTRFTLLLFLQICNEWRKNVCVCLIGLEYTQKIVSNVSLPESTFNSSPLDKMAAISHVRYFQLRFRELKVLYVD